MSLIRLWGSLLSRLAEVTFRSWSFIIYLERRAHNERLEREIQNTKKNQMNFQTTLAIHFLN